MRFKSPLWSAAILMLAAVAMSCSAVHAKRAERGATMPFTTYEAEAGELGGSARTNVDDNVREASSGKSYVHLAATGDYVQFNDVAAANRLIVRYSIPKGSDGTLSLYVNGKLSQKLQLAPTQCYDNDRPDFYVRRYDEKAIKVIVPSGARIRLQKDPDDTCSWYGIDLIDLEKAPKPGQMPPHFLSITEFGADPTGVLDSRSAVEKCMEAAAAQHEGVWVPLGIFTVSSRIQAPTGVNLRGAGYWYSTLYYPTVGTGYSDAIGFKLDGDNNVSNIKFVGNGMSRDRATILFSTIGNNVTLDQCWIQNVACVFGWCDYDHSVVKNCRVYGTYFDCIHWGDGAACYNLAENNYFRGAGDDAIAQVNRSDYALAHDNVAEFNTVVASYWGRGMSDIGGDSLILRDNIISSTYNAGIMIATEALGTIPCRAIRGLTILRNTIEHCGHTGFNHASIHCWLDTNPMQDVVIDSCLVENGETQGVHFDKTTYGDSGGRTIIKDTTVVNNAKAPYDNASDLILPILTDNTMK